MKQFLQWVKIRSSAVFILIYIRLTKTAALQSDVAVMPCLTRTALHAPTVKRFPTQLSLFFPPSFKCILPLCLRKTGLSPFMWVFPLITLSPSVSLWGLVEMAEKSELLCSAFTPHCCREEGGGGGGEKRWALIQLKIMRVEGFSSGVADVLNMDDHMQHIHLHLHRASLQSTQQPLHAQQTPQHRHD